MVALVTLVGIVIVIFGVVYTVKPATIKKVLHFWSKGNRIYIGAIINILFGIFFLRSASLCYMPWFVSIMGVLSLVKGVLLLALGKKKALSFIESIELEIIADSLFDLAKKYKKSAIYEVV